MVVANQPVNKRTEIPEGEANAEAAESIEMALRKRCQKRMLHTVSNFGEIQEAVKRLPADEKKALSLWLNSQTIPELTSDEEQRLLRSLDEAVCDLDAGKGVTISDVRKRLASWAVE